MADDWNLPSASKAKAKKNKWLPSQEQLIEASACYGSFVGIPSRKESGADLKSADIANIDVDAEIELLDVLTLDGPTEAGGLTQSEIQSQMEALRDQFLGEAYHAVVADKLNGKIPINLLLSRIRARTGVNYNRDDAVAIISEVAGGDKNHVPRTGIMLLYGDPE